MNFQLSVLRVNQGKDDIPDVLKKELRDNAVYVRKHSVWLFEGDWETVLDPWVESQNIRSVGEIITGSLGGLSDRALAKIVEDEIDIDEMRQQEGGK